MQDYCQCRGVARIFFGGTLRPLKGYHAPSAGGPGAKAPRMVAKFHFFKTIQGISNIATFFLPKNPFFLRKLSKIEQILQEFLNFFGKIFLTFSIFMIIYKAREIHGGFYYQVEKIIKRKLKIQLRQRRTIEEDQRGSKIPGNFFNLHKKISMGISVFHIFNALL